MKRGGRVMEASNAKAKDFTLFGMCYIFGL
jgi:hypothetical protein